MLNEFATISESLKTAVAGLDVACIDGRQAKELVRVCSEIERIAAAAKTLAVGRVESTGVWAWSGAKSPADWLANVSGTELRAAIETVEVARAIETLPATAAVLREGRLSSAQAAAVTRAAVKDPGSEQRLLSAARMGMGDLKREAKRVNATARTGENEEAKAKRQRALRSVSFWNDDEGMACASLRLEPKFGITLRRCIERAADKDFNAARKLGVRDTTEQYAADAFVAFFTNAITTAAATAAEPAETASLQHAGPRPTPVAAPVVSGRQVEVITVIDYNALVRGELEPGERCEIPGVGPIPVSLAREYLLGGAFLKVLIADGVDIKTVCHIGRKLPAELKTAIDYRDPTCAVAGCNRTKGLERHHLHPIKANGVTSLENQRRVCGHDHDLITHHGYELGPPDTNGNCQLIPPKNRSG